MDAMHPPCRRHAQKNDERATVSRPATRHTKIATLLALAALAAACALLAPPFTRPAAYYRFADARTLIGVPHFMDVASSLPWLLVGTLGLLFVARTPAR